MHGAGNEPSPAAPGQEYIYTYIKKKEKSRTSKDDQKVYVDELQHLYYIHEYTVEGNNFAS